MAQYIQNPDVNIREESDSGALLFNPDTNQVQVLNRSGKYIWKMCEKGCTITDIIDAIKADFDDVPDGDVEKDVEEFIVLVDIPKSHKTALFEIARGEEIIKYGEVIAVSSEKILKGQWVHTHNLKSDTWKK